MKNQSASVPSTWLKACGFGGLSSALVAILALVLNGAPAVHADEETCTKCGQGVSITGEFAHAKYDDSLPIEGADNNAAAFREEIYGETFTVTIEHLPAGQYTISIGEAETWASAPGQRIFSVTSGDATLAKDFDIIATAGVARKVCYSLRYWATEPKQYVVEPGKYQFLLGASSDDIRIKLPLKISDRRGHKRKQINKNP